jgi:uncharacterized protein
MSDEQENLTTIKKMYDAIFASDMDTFKTYLDPEIVVFEADSLPYGGTYIGTDGVERLWAAVYGAWDDVAFKVTNFTAGGDSIVVLGHFSARGKTTGKTFSFPQAELWRFRGGLAFEWRPFYFDTKKVCDVFGV